MSRGLFLTFLQTQDAKLMTVTPTARQLFTVIITFAVEAAPNGRLNQKQIALCANGILHPGRYLAQLCEQELLRYDAAVQEYQVVDPGKWLVPGRNWRSNGDDTGKQKRAELDPILTRPARKSDPNSTRTRPYLDPNSTRTRPELPKVADVPAAQNGHSPEPPRARTQPPARPCAGSFEVSFSTRTNETPKDVRDAPRSGGGAARPARKTDPIEVPEMPPDGVTLPGAEARALMRAELQKGRKNNPAATGKDTSFTKYPTDRPTDPIKLELFREADSE